MQCCHHFCIYFFFLKLTQSCFQSEHHQKRYKRHVMSNTNINIITVFSHKHNCHGGRREGLNLSFRTEIICPLNGGPTVLRWNGELLLNIVMTSQFLWPASLSYSALHASALQCVTQIVCWFLRQLILFLQNTSAAFTPRQMAVHVANSKHVSMSMSMSMSRQ
jgi:hypothetical protein